MTAKSAKAKRDLSADADVLWGSGNWVSCDACPLNGGKAAIHHVDGHTDPPGFRSTQDAPAFVA